MSIQTLQIPAANASRNYQEKKIKKSQNYFFSFPIWKSEKGGTKK